MYAQLRKIKFFLDRLTNPLMLFLHGIGVRPAHLTFLSFLSGVIGSYFMFTNWLYAIFFLAVWFLLDVGDGMLARATKTESEFGAKLDFLVDRVVLVLILCRYYEFRQESKLAVVSGLLAVLILTIGELVGRRSREKESTKRRIK